MLWQCSGGGLTAATGPDNRNNDLPCWTNQKSLFIGIESLPQTKFSNLNFYATWYFDIWYFKLRLFYLTEFKIWNL